MKFLRDVARVLMVMAITLAIMASVFVAIYFLMWEEQISTPIESTRTVMLTCTVKSNIEGVITLNDDCKITVIGEE